jgi:RNA polymerase sigma factor (TIGR02999 family)
MSDVTHLLDAAAAGDRQAAADLLPLVYDELRRLAAGQMANERPGHTLDATALVHEAYLRLVGDCGASKGSNAPLPCASGPEVGFANRRHFFAAAAEAMRRILIDQARRKQSRKRGGDLVRHDVADLDLALPEPREDLLALDEALRKLAQTEPQAAELVQLRFFAGFALVDAAEALGVSPRTAHRLWAYARAYLHREMQR